MLGHNKSLPITTEKGASIALLLQPVIGRTLNDPREYKFSAMENNLMEWIKDVFPKEAGDYLVTLYGDSMCENYVIPCRYESRPYNNPCRFYSASRYNKDEDVTDYVIAWIKIPKPYEETHNPINSVGEDAWMTQHL